MSDAYLGARTPGDSGDLFTAMMFIAKQVQQQGWTATMVKVLAVYGGGVDKPGQVDVQPMVNQLNGLSQPTPHATLSRIPYGRIQFGTSAIICDPKEGDVGLAVFASHDITAVLSTGDVSNPGSRRRFDPSDGIYVITLIGQQPETFIQFTTDGGINITCKSGQNVVVTADEATVAADTINLQGRSGDTTLTITGDGTVSGNLTVLGNLIT